MRNACGAVATIGPLDPSSRTVGEEGFVFQAPIEAQTEREFRRSRVLMTATLMTPEGAVSVRIRDLSLAGAQVWAELPIPANCDAILKRGPFFAAARVVRSEGHFAGLQFYRQLSDDEFASAFQRNSRISAVPA
jgi:hypothetical protein